MATCSFQSSTSTLSPSQALKGKQDEFRNRKERSDGNLDQARNSGTVRLFALRLSLVELVAGPREGAKGMLCRTTRKI